MIDIDQILKIAGALVPVLSALSSFLNHLVRKDVVEGRESPQALLVTGAVLNAGAVNVDKAVQLVKMIRANVNKEGK